MSMATRPGCNLSSPAPEASPANFDHFRSAQRLVCWSYILRPTAALYNAISERPLAPKATSKIPARRERSSFCGQCRGSKQPLGRSSEGRYVACLNLGLDDLQGRTIAAGVAPWQITARDLVRVV